MAIDFKKLNKKVDLQGLQNDVEDAKNNEGGNYKEVPHGEYEVKIEKLELVLSKKGDPMVSIWYKILEGEYKDSLIFQNQVITQGFQIHIMNEFLRTLEVIDDVEFEDYEQYNDLLLDISEKIEEEKLEFALEYSCNNKGYNTFKVLEIFESDK